MDQSRDRSFADLLRRARRDAGMTQEQLAALAGISTRAVSDLERGINRAPQRETLRLLADALDLSPAERRAWNAARRQLARRPGLPVRHASVASSPSTVYLPRPLTSFVGRDREVADVVGLLRQSRTRLVTITGTGGVGKTRLALAAAQAVEALYPDGVWFVNLAPVHDARLVFSALATTLSVPVAGQQPALTALIAALRDTHRLLLLDNVEQVAAAAPGLADLLVACPSLVLLATSRVPLRIQGEREYAVMPFPLPDDTVMDLDRLRSAAAIDLFEQRARDVDGGFRVTEQNARAVAAICRRVDGLPLAIELVAARIRLLPPGALLARLERRLPLLTGAPHDVPIRQQTLRNTLSWSYELLDPEHQRLFRALAVFHGGWTLDAAEAVGGDPEAGDGTNGVLSGLETLIAHHLVRMREQPDGEPRYAMLETITEFARELLAASTAGQAFHQRHAQYFLAFAEQAEPHLEGEEQARWLALLQTEHANHRAAMQWALEQAAQGDTDALVTSFRLTAALWWFWHISGHVPEGRAQMEMVMDLLRANQAVLQTSMQPAGWSRMYAKTLFMLGAYSTWTADHHDERGWSLLAESLDLYRELDQKEDMAWTLLFMGYGAQRIGRFTEADTFLTEGLALFRALGDDRGAGMVLQGLGMIALRSGDDERGGVWLAESLALFTTLGDVRSIAASRATLGAVRLRQGDLVRANALLGESLKVRLQIGDKGGIAWCLEWLAEAALLGLPPPSGPLRAARLLGAAKALRAAVGLPIDPVDQPGNERVVTAVQAKLSDRAFIAAWEAGRAMTPERAGAYALIADDDGTAQDLVSRFVMSRSR